MFNLEKIKEYYPENLHSFERHLLREYLQCKILEIVYDSKMGKEMVFMGGTALRIVYGNQRFSEDLDFDSKGISFEEFKELSQKIKEGLSRQGLEVEINPKKTETGAFVNKLKVLDLLHDEDASPHEGEKLTIKVDAADQEYDYSPNIYNLDKFDVYTKIKVAPMDLILAQKFYCLLNRNRVMGRDLFDINFLINNKQVEKPDFNYLKEKTSIDNSEELRRKSRNICDKLDLDKLAEKTEFLLINPAHKKRVKEFPHLIEKLLNGC